MTCTSVRLSLCLLLHCCTLPLMAQRVAGDSVVPGHLTQSFFDHFPGSEFFNSHRRLHSEPVVSRRMAHCKESANTLERDGERVRIV